MKKGFIVMALAATFALTAVTPAEGQTKKTSQTKTDKKDNKQKTYKTWTSWAAHLEPEFFTTAEAVRIGDNVLLYQQNTGGWPKNIDMARNMTDADKKKAEADKSIAKYSTIDNRATSTEIIYLSKLYNATGTEKYKDAVLRGMQYLFEAQYDNGGWPRFIPTTRSITRTSHITTTP